ncbi:MAG: GNAT family N-acetyltransferase [Nitriliruptorales bacterium]|nr:GNAT family N-acetyltransferase [Nitriliruptorales bacterium]
MSDLSLLPIVDDDLPFIRAMLYEAAFWRGGADAPPIEEAMRQPSLAVYVNQWGRRGDRGVVVRVSGKPAGAVWVRLFDDDNHGYGYVDDQTPELSMAVVEEHRGCGLGRCLLASMLAQARLDGVARVSLSVEPDNPARLLYQDIGFTPAETLDGALTMVCTLR